ncbi:MAG: transcriptional repressor [Verrucomicrobia bacterium]|nr:transcriptional repressor [Verrucomicrobiota bacterium]
MKPGCQTTTSNTLNARLATGGFRSTAQRQQVYEILQAQRDHPTAEEVFIRAKREMPDISMATVYNCLDALVKCHLIRLVNLDRGATRYCANMEDHAHFYCNLCGRFFDIEPQAVTLALPEGFQVTHTELSMRGSCPECGANHK